MSKILGITLFHPALDGRIVVEADDIITDSVGIPLSLEEARLAVMQERTPFVTVHTKMQRVTQRPHWHEGDAVLPLEYRPPPERYDEERSVPRKFLVDIPTRGTIVGTELDEEMPDDE